MNRQERRAKQKEDKKARKKLWPGGFIEVSDREYIKNADIKDGDKLTVPGIKRYKNGIITRNCKPGDETEWIAKIITD